MGRRFFMYGGKTAAPYRFLIEETPDIKHGFDDFQLNPDAVLSKRFIRADGQFEDFGFVNRYTDYASVVAWANGQDFFCVAIYCQIDIGTYLVRGFTSLSALAPIAGVAGVPVTRAGYNALLFQNGVHSMSSAIATPVSLLTRPMTQFLIHSPTGANGYGGGFGIKDSSSGNRYYLMGGDINANNMCRSRRGGSLSDDAAKILLSGNTGENNLQLTVQRSRDVVAATNAQALYVGDALTDGTDRNWVQDTWDRIMLNSDLSASGMTPGPGGYFMAYYYYPIDDEALISAVNDNVNSRYI
jgi:hypothetical protein